MKGAIFYSSKYGSTQTYSRWIGDATGLPTFSIEEHSAQPTDYDFLVLASPIIYFRLSIRRWVKRHAWSVVDRPTLLVTVSGSPPGPKLNRWIARSLPSEVRKRVDHFALQGRQRPSDLTLFDRLMLKIGAMFNRDPRARREELQGFDYMDRSTIAPIVDRIRMLQSETTGQPTEGTEAR